MNHSKCPRCGSLAYEHLRTHSYCWECGYSPDQDARAAMNNGRLKATAKPPLKNRQPAVAVNSGQPGLATKSKFFIPREPSAVNSNADRPGAKERLH